MKLPGQTGLERTRLGERRKGGGGGGGICDADTGLHEIR